MQVLYGDALEPKCHCGDQKSCLLLGLDFFKKGQYSKAIPLLKNSCDDKIAPACGVVAISYREGRGVDVDLDEAIAYFKKGCDLNYTKVCSDLSDVYRKKGLYKKAFDIDKQNCDNKKVRGSCYNVAKYYLDGKYVEDNISLAEHYFDLSCKYGAKQGCKKYSLLHIEKYIETKLEPNKIVKFHVTKCDKKDFKMPIYEATMQYTYIKDKNKTSRLVTFEFNNDIPKEIKMAVLEDKNCVVKKFETKPYLKLDGYKVVVNIGYEGSKIKNVISMFAKKSKNKHSLYNSCLLSKKQEIKTFKDKIVIYYDKKIKSDRITVFTTDNQMHNFILKFPRPQIAFGDEGKTTPHPYQTIIHHWK